MRTIKANTKANGDILPEPKFKRITERLMDEIKRTIK